MNIAALKSPNFRTYIAGNLFAVNGLWMLRVTVGWIAWDITGSASFVGLIAFLYFAPTLFAGPLFGVLTDRINVRHAVLVAQTALMFLAALLLVLHLSDLLGQAQLVFYALAAGVAMSAHSPARMSMGPRLVARDQVGSVVTLTAINFNLARMTGPAIGGALIATQGIAVTLLITALCYLPFIAAVSVVDIRERSNVKDAPPPFLTALMEGVRHVAADDIIRRALLLTAVSCLFIRGALEILPVLADGVFAKGASGLGLLTSAAGLGALLAGLTLAAWTMPAPRGLPVRASAFCLAGLILTAILGFTTHWPSALVLTAAMGFTATMIGITCQTAIQTDLDDAIRGRVMSLWGMIAIGATALGAAIDGLLADLIGFGPTLALTAALAVAVLAGFVWRHGLHQIAPR